MRATPLFRSGWPLVAALALTACNKEGGTLVDVVAVEPGAECPAGGVRIETGIDEDGDGALSEGEVATSDVICEGEDPPPASGVATRSTDLPVGDADCPHGGVRIDAGLDDGADGGTAGDGVLQDGEVDSSTFVCEPTPPAVGRPVEPPAGPAGTSTIDLGGGAGSHGAGGDAGSLLAEVDYGTFAGGIRLFPTGAASTGAAFPTDFAVELGPVPVVIATTTTLALDPTLGTLADGTPFLRTGVFELAVRDSTHADGFRVATGLRVAAGATLTLPVNQPGGPRVNLVFTHDVHVAGTITTPRTGGVPAELRLNVGAFVGEATGRIDLAGADGTSTAGALGGILWVNGYSVVNAATIDVSGGTGTEGAPAGQVVLGVTRLWNRGALIAHGGDGTTGQGGAGSDRVQLSGDEGAHLEGSVDLSGGDGATGAGVGGEFELWSLRGPVASLGPIEASGGSVTACPTTCSGGDGGEVKLRGAEVVTSGGIRASGGDAPRLETTSGTTGGGSGGTLEIVVGDATEGLSTDYTALGDIEVSGDLDLSGGDGGSGGEAGTIEVWGDYEQVAADQQIAFLGYALVDLSGGDGETQGGEGGEAQLYTSYALGTTYGSGGAIANHVDFDLTGGNGDPTASGDGGRGGSFWMGTDTNYGLYSPWEIALNRGDLLADGGTGRIGGAPGFISMYGSAGVENSGLLSAGSGDGQIEALHMPTALFLTAEEGPVSMSGTMRAVGGSVTTGQGDQGGWVYLYGKGVSVTGTIDVHGGNGSTGGGWGGTIYASSRGGPSSITGTVEVTGGTGTTPGGHGEVIVDGENLTATFLP